jgi:ATP-dependent RNA helicase DeaD
MELPSTELINDKRVAKFKQRITDTLANEDLGLFTQMIEQYQQEHNVPAEEVAAAIAKMLQGDTPFLLQKKTQSRANKNRAKDSWDKAESAPHKKRARNQGERTSRKETMPEEGMEQYRIEVGHNHDVQPGNIVGAIANEAGFDSKFIGRINIYDDYSLVDLPEGMPKEVFNLLKNVWVSGQKLKISRLNKERKTRDSDKRPPKKGKKKDKAGKKKAKKKKVRKK